MVRSAWLNSVRTWVSRTASRPLVRRRPGNGRTSLASDIRLLGDRVMLSAAALDADAAELWTPIEAFPSNTREVSYLNLTDFTALTMNDTAMRQTLDAAPDESAFNFSVNTNTVTLVDPDGNAERFAIYETQVMAPELAAQFPEIKTYSGKGIDDPTATVQLDLTPQGFHAQVLSEGGRWYIDPYFHMNHDFYASYYARDARPDAADVAQAQETGLGHGSNDVVRPAVNQPIVASAEATTAARSGTQLRTYRLAVAATGEYTAFHGGTVPLGQAAIVTAINRVNGIYQNELSITMQLVGNNSSLVYNNSATDPYTNNDGGVMLGQNQTNVDTVIGNGNYDIGHVFSTGGGGIAGLGVVGINSAKAEGVTGLGSPTGDAFWVDYVSHEMGHQFGADHTFNTSMDPNRNGPTAYEPGSGSTIMSYAGLEGADDLQAHSDAYFHSASFDQIITHVDTVIPAVGTRTATGNFVPTVNAGSDFTIPAGTPFTLTAAGSDGNSDPIFFNWEERDLGPAQLLTDADNGSSPLFKSFLSSFSTSSESRTFPSLSTVLGSPAVPGEKLPTVARTMNFRATARDKRAGGGGVNTDDMVVNVVNTGSAFAITSQNAGGSFAGNTTQTVTWNVAGTTANGINTANVRILLSTNGGATFGTVLAASTPNDGTQSITLPNSATTRARIKVEAVGNIFFDINNANFTITATANQSPVMNNQTFSVAAGAPNGTVVGTIVATDADVGQTLSFFPFFESNPGVFDVNLSTGVITVANSAALTVGLSATIGVNVTDSGTPPLGTEADMTINVTAANTAPSIGGAAANQTMNDNQTKAVFSGLTITDPDTSVMSAQISIQNGIVRGDFTPDSATGWTRSVVGNDIRYISFFASSVNIGSVVQTAIRLLTFDPRENAIRPNATETTVFGVTVTDGIAAPVSNTLSSVIVTSVNNNEVLGGQANLSVNDSATINPLSNLSVTDPDFQEGYVKVTILNGVARGDFTAGSTTGWTRTVLGNNIDYFKYFNPGANVGATLQAAARALVFQPRQNVLVPGATELTDFQVVVSDGIGGPVSNVGSYTRLTTTSANDGPSIGGTVANQTMNDNQTKAVFSTVTITDPDNDDMNVIVTIPNGVNRGDFTAGSTTGWTRTVVGIDIRYNRYFSPSPTTASTVQTAIRALVFQPRTNVPIGTTETIGFTIFVTDGTVSTTNSTTSVITTGVAPRTAAVSTILDSDIATVVVPSLKKAAANGLARLLKKSR